MIQPSESPCFHDGSDITSNAVSSPDTATVRGRGQFEVLIVPTLNGWGLLTLIVLMLLLGAVLVRPFAA